MKNGCGKPVTKGHGDVAVCGKDFYGEIYTCDSCLKLRVAELEAVLLECLDALKLIESGEEINGCIPSLGWAVDIADEALTLPTDSTKILADVRRAERERMIILYSHDDSVNDLFDKIRQMED